MSDPIQSDLNPVLLRACFPSSCAHIDLGNSFSAVAGRLATDEEIAVYRGERSLSADQTVVVIGTATLNGTGVKLDDTFSLVAGNLAGEAVVAAVRSVYELPEHEKVITVSNADLGYAPALAA